MPLHVEATQRDARKPAAGCVDVERRFPQYKLGYEDRSFTATQDPWHKVIVCKYGHICPAGGSKLWACTNSNRGDKVKALRQLAENTPGMRLVMDGDDGINVEFDVFRWQEVFRIMGAKSR